MKIYITRHGETQWNQQGRMQGRQNSSLTAKGISDAKKLQKRLASVEFHHIYSSPLGRALETAEILRGDRNLPIEEVSHFREMHFGLWEGRTLGEIEGVYGEGYRNFWEAPEKFQPVEGESFEELLARVGHGLRLLGRRKDQGEAVCLLVAHAVVIKAIYVLVKNLSVKEFWNPPFMYGTNLSILEIKGEERRFLLEGDMGHLQEVAQDNGFPKNHGKEKKNRIP